MQKAETDLDCGRCVRGGSTSQITSRTKFIGQNRFGVTQTPQNELWKPRGAGLERLLWGAPWGGLTVGGGYTR